MKPGSRLIGSLLLIQFFVSSPVLAQGSGLSLDSLMSSSSSESVAEIEAVPVSVSNAQAANESNISLDQLLESSGPTPTALDASLDLGTIEEGRRLANQRDATNNLTNLDHRINQNCSCADSSCFNLRDINISQQVIIDAAIEAESTLGSQMQSVCSSWPGIGAPSQDLAAVETRIAMANRILDAITQIDNSANEVVSNLEQQDAEIRYAIAQQEEQESGFNWGQFTAMTAGVVAGGIGNLDPNAQAEIMSSIISDSFDGGGGMSSFESTMNSLNADLATMQQSFESNMSDSAISIGPSVEPGYSGSSLGGLDSLLPNAGTRGIDTTSTNSASPGSSGSSSIIQETYSFTCPSGTQANIPIVTDSPACASAMRNYARVMSCNLIDDMESAQRQYESACAAEIY